MIKIFRKHFTIWYVRNGFKIRHTPYQNVYEFICPKRLKRIAKWLFSYETYLDEKYKTEVI